MFLSPMKMHRLHQRASSKNLQRRVVIILRPQPLPNLERNKLLQLKLKQNQPKKRNQRLLLSHKPLRLRSQNRNNSKIRLSKRLPLLRRLMNLRSLTSLKWISESVVSLRFTRTLLARNFIMRRLISETVRLEVLLVAFRSWSH